VVRGLDLRRLGRKAGITGTGKQFHSDVDRGHADHTTANRPLKPDGLDGDSGHDATATSS
jgi:hypothetical protein